MAEIHWVPLTRSSVITSTQIQRANNLLSSRHYLIDCNVKKFTYNEHPDTTSTFSCIKVLVVSGTQCKDKPCDKIQSIFTCCISKCSLFWLRICCLQWISRQEGTKLLFGQFLTGNCIQMKEIGRERAFLDPFLDPPRIYRILLFGTAFFSSKSAKLVCTVTTRRACVTVNINDNTRGH